MKTMTLPKTMRARMRALAGVLVLATVAGCSGVGGGSGGDGSGGGQGGQGEHTGQAGTDPSLAGPATTLRVLAGSEIADMTPVLEAAKQATGVAVELDYVGTLEGAEQIASGQAAKTHDAAWFSSNRYLGLLPDGNNAITTSAKIMDSPVIVGVTQTTAKTLGWDTKAPTWADIGKAAAAGTFTYGMTDPTASNSGFSALVGVATALSGTGAAIDAAQVAKVTPQLTNFFSGQKLTSGSSGWLADTFVKKQGAGPGASGAVDGIINYESVLLGLNTSGRLTEPLTLVYPSDGVISGDYPLSLLAGSPAASDPATRSAFDRLTAWLRTPEAQQQIMTTTHRRPVVPGVQPAAEFGDRLLVELPFPAQKAATDALLASYQNKVRRPSQTVYVLDTSGSMRGDRLAQLVKAFAVLSGSDRASAQGLKGFRDRERVTLLPFSSTPAQPQVFEVEPANAAATLTSIKGAVDGLVAQGETAIYDALTDAYAKAGAEMTARPDAFTSIVLMSDGERTVGSSVDQFLDTYAKLPENARSVPTFTVLFGDSDVEELQRVAEATGGKVFDARTASLADIFKEIRGYQ